MSSESRFQQRLVETIKTGKLEDFIALKVSKNEINTKLLPTENIIPVPKYSTKDTYFCPKEPTPLMLAVLCERDDIVKYILDNLDPKLEIKSNGFNAFHLSVLTKDHKCFDLLFSCQYYQEHVEEPIEIPAQIKKEFETIIIHPAVSCSNYYAVLSLLSSKPPEIKYPDKSRTSGEPYPYKPVDVNAVSQTGSTPLKIAVHCRNTDMVCILKYFGASNTEPKESNAQDYLDMLVNKLKESNSQSKEKQLKEYEQIQKYMNDKDIYSDLNTIKLTCGFKQIEPEEEEDYDDIPVAAAPTVNKSAEKIVQSITKSVKSHVCHGNNCNREGTLLNEVDGFYYCQVCYGKAKKH